MGGVEALSRMCVSRVSRRAPPPPIPATQVFPVNGIAWHPTEVESFATVGGDSSFCFWEKKKKQRLKIYETRSTGM